MDAFSTVNQALWLRKILSNLKFQQYCAIEICFYEKFTIAMGRTSPSWRDSTSTPNHAIKEAKKEIELFFFVVLLYKRATSWYPY